MTAIFGGWLCARAPAAKPSATAALKRTFVFTVKLLILNIILAKKRRCSERSADCEAERRVWLQERHGLADRSFGRLISGVIWEKRTVGGDRRLQIAAEQQRVVRPIYAEGRVDYRH